MRELLSALRTALENDDPIDLDDVELLELAELSADELRRRLPRYALDQGDLDASSEPQIEAREDLLDAIRSAKETI